jgi:PAS domain S-box-containing protein
MVEISNCSTISELLDSGEFIFFKWENRPKWPVSFVSENTTDILGYTPKSFRQGVISYSEIIHPDDLPTVIEEVKKYSKSNIDRFTHKPYRVIKKDKTTIWVYDTTRIIRDDLGDIIYYVGYIMDITPLKEREIALEKRTQNLKSEISTQTDTIMAQKQKLHILNAKLKEDVKVQKTLYEELFNSTKDGIVLFKGESILEHNRAILKMMKCESRDDLQNMLSSFFSDTNSTSMSDMFTKATKDGLYRFDWQIKLKDGSRLWTEVTLTPMKIQNEMTMHSHWRDITRRKELEIINKEKTNQLIQQSRFAQMGEMISMIAHQWRQPLSAIAATITAMQTKIMFSKMEDTKDKDDNSTYLLEQFTKINSNIQYMSQTINDFRNFFKPNKEATKFYLSDAFNRVFSMLEQSFINNSIKVNLNFDKLNPIYTYENEIIQVLLNLLKNAKDALIENRIKKPKIEVFIHQGDDTQSIIIMDNAGGIQEDQLEKIFDPYFSTKSKNGTGLGLYMSKTIIQEHCQGTIQAYNTEDGACFVIELPTSLKENP